MLGFSNRTIQPPEELLSPPVPKDSFWWGGLIRQLNPIVMRIPSPTLLAPHLDNYLDGTNIAAHPTHPEWFTKCLIPTNFEGALSQFASKFKFKSVKAGRGGKIGYFKLKELGLTMGNMFVPAQEVYLNWLLCFMYRGPPTSPGLEACHMCDNNMCLAPWHMVWATHKQNMKAAFTHKRNRHKYHPYGMPQQVS